MGGRTDNETVGDWDDVPQPLRQLPWAVIALRLRYEGEYMVIIPTHRPAHGEAGRAERADLA